MHVIHFYRYISALTTILVAFTTYAVGVAPWIEPPPIRRAQMTERGPVAPPVSEEKKAELATLFPPGHWVLANPKIVETEQCTLLIQDYKPVEGGNLELKPCVLIFRARGAATASPADGSAPTKRGRPIILEAPKAELAFDRPLNVTRASFGRVEKGTLAGEVTIYSPPTTPTSGDELRVRTRAVWLDRQSIRTSNDVDFQYGDSSGRGRILEITLKSGEEGDKKQAKSHLGPLQSVTLRHLDYLRLATAGRGVLGGALPTAKAPAGAQDPAATIGGAQPADNAPIEVRCQGEFTFDCIAQIARFEKQVEVKRLLPNVAPDTLRCDELQLAFGVPQNPPAATPNDDPLAGRLQRLVAMGAPAVLESPSSRLRAVAANMEYSVANRRVILKADSQRNVPQVTLVQNEQHFAAPEVHYEMIESSRLGRLHATGPGDFRMLQGEGPEQQTITARWQKTLQIQPQDQFQVISLVQASTVTIDPLGRFDGNELHLWVQEMPATDRKEGLTAGPGPAENNMSLAGSPLKDSPAAPSSSLVPHRLEAVGAVRVVSEQLDVDTNRLQAWFVNLPPGAGDVQPQRLPPIAPPPIHEPVQPAGYLAENTPQAAIRDVKPQNIQRFHVGGEQIQLQAIVRGRQFELEDLVIDGKADILETRMPQADLEPIFARGTHLELRQGSKPAATTVQINGFPAEIGGRGVSLAGRQIDMDRGRNELRIDGLGEATMPMQAAQTREQGTVNRGQTGVMMPLASSAGSAGAIKNGPPEKLHIVWHDGFIFDGLTARFAGNVEMRTPAQLALAPILEVTLNQRVDFQSIGSAARPERSIQMPAAQPGLARVFLEGGQNDVYGKNDTLDELGQLVSRDQMRARAVIVDWLSGKMHAQGPGWVSSVRKGAPQAGVAGRREGEPPAQQPFAQMRQPGDSSELTSIHVAFEKELVGDLNNRQFEFHQQVETTYSPASDFGNVIAADAIKDLSERVVLMTSDVLKVTEFVQPPPRWFEVQATGNTKVRGQKFDVDAPVVGYSSQKELLKIEGDGRANAKAWVRQALGDKPNIFEGERFTYNLKNGEWQTDVVKNIHINLPPNMKFGLPSIPGGAAPAVPLGTMPTNSSRRFP
jgi:hypothetical protein